MTDISGLSIDRRAFTKLAAGATGGLMLGVTFGCSNDERSTSASSAPQTFNAYVRIAPDDTIVLVNPSVEMGQGVNTAMPQIMADELDARWDQIRVESAPFDAAYNNPIMPTPMQSTAASTSVRGYFEPLRQAAAAAREMLVMAAAERWAVAPDACETADGAVIRRSDGARLTYGELAEAAAALQPPAAPRLKSQAEFTLIGQSLKSPERQHKVDGSLAYTIDYTVPGMLHAALKLTPVFGGRLASFDEGQAASVPGFRRVVPLDDGIAVIADRYWQAKKALEAVTVEFGGGDAGFNTGSYYETLRVAAETDEGAVFLETGDAPGHLAAASTRVEGTYVLPYLAHVAMEPLSCIAKVEANSCELWSGTQNITRSTTLVAEFLGLPPDRVTVHAPVLGGSFGRRIGYDIELRAVEIAKAVGAPVKVIWSREEDVRHDHYRPSVAAHFTAVLDDTGRPQALDVRVASQPFIIAGKSRSTVRDDGVDTGIMGSLNEMAYDIPNLRLAYVQTVSPVTAGTWRSVPRSYNTFIIESLIDELAHKVGEDPYTYRRALIKDDPQLIAVLDKAAEAAGWQEPLPPGHGRGIAAWSGYRSRIAQVIEIAVSAGEIELVRVVNAVNCGLVINPDIVVQQMEGGMLQGLTAALRNEIKVKDGAVEQSNFHDYQLLSLSETPAIDTYIVASDDAPGGIGELATPAIQAALTNAIFAATGIRIRHLPVSRHDLTAGG